MTTPINSERQELFGSPFVVPDPDTVFHDALYYSPWTAQGGSLPERGDWSTYRLASKDIILGVIIHRFNPTTRQLDVRSYFCGEHPLFEEFEATRALMAILLCQAYQAGGSLEINFELGIPFDVRMLVERQLNLVLSGNATVLAKEVGAPLFVSLSGISERLQLLIAEQDVPLGLVCYHIFRGTWSPFQVNALLERGYPLRWVFKRCPDPIGSPSRFAHLVQGLRAILLEEYALRRLEDRQFGETTSRRVTALDGGALSGYTCEQNVELTAAPDGEVRIAATQEFVLLPVLPATPDCLNSAVGQSLVRARAILPNKAVILVFPMDVMYAKPHQTEIAIEQARAHNLDWLVVRQTMVQLLSEVEQKLAITAAREDEDEVDAKNLDRYSD